MSKYDAMAYYRKKMAKQSEEDEEKASLQTSQSNGYDAMRYFKSKSLGLDTFETDLKTMGKTVYDLSKNWQTQETMNNTRAAVEGMYGRINSYMDYQKQYGGADLTDLQSSYKKVLDNWDKQTKLYGGFKNADAYNKSVKNSELEGKFNGLTYDEVQAELKKYKPGSDEHNFLSNYTGYTDLEDFDKAIKNYVPTEGENELATIKAERDAYQKEYKEKGGYIPSASHYNRPAYSQVDDYHEYQAKMAEYDKRIKELEGSGYLDELEAQKNLYELKYGVYDDYKDVESNADFEKGSQYVSSGDKVSEYINGDETKRSQMLNDHYAPKWMPYTNANEVAFTQPSIYEKYSLDELEEREIKLYNYLAYEDKKNGTNKAQEYLDGMQTALNKRATDKLAGDITKEIDNSVAASAAYSLLSIPMNIAGGISSLGDTITGNTNPYSTNKLASNMASTIRTEVGANIEEGTEGFELFGQNIPSFLYQTGMSMGDTALGGAALGPGYSIVAGSSAFQQKHRELIDAGENEDTALYGALGSGLAEMVFEYVSLDKLMKIDGVDGIKKGIKSALKQGGIEASEEFFTEMANIIIDEKVRGESSELNQYRKDLKERGYTDKEIEIEVAKKIGGQLGWAAAGGFASGTGMGAGASLKSGVQNHSIGKDIQARNRTSDMLDIAGLTPQESEAYKVYNEYAQKGITADNIKPAQLGNLYSTAKAEATETLHSKKTSGEDKASAFKTLQGLSKVDTENTDAKRKAELTVGETTKVTTTGNATAIDGIKLDKEGTTLVTNDGEIAIEDMTLSDKDADLVVKAEGIAKEYGDEIGNLFLAQYDGETNVEHYANSFNLTMAYAKNNFTQELMLENRGALSPTQVQSIYNATVHAKSVEQDNKIKALSESQGKKQFIEGKFDDSIIDYDGTSTDGSKVKWKDLKPKQRAAIKFAQLFSKATGVNIRFIKSEVRSGKHKGENGSYNSETNTIEIDVFAGRINAKDVNDSIIPTLSHEMTHWMKHKASAIYDSIRNDVMETLAKEVRYVNGKAIKLSETDLIELEMDRMKRAHPGMKVTPEDAIDELVARACEDMLSNSNAARKLLNKMSAKEQQDFISKIKETFENLIQWVNDLLAHYTSDSEEAQILGKYKHNLQRISKQWDAMLLTAIESNQALQNEGITGEKLANQLASANELQFNERLVEKHIDLLAEKYDAKESTLPLETLLQRYDKIIEMWKKLGGELNSKFLEDWNNKKGTDRTFTIFKAQAGYKYNVELSSMCKKGIPLFEAIDKIVKDEAMKELRSKTLGKAEKEILYDILKGHNFEIPCAICYVEQARQREGKIINDFLNGNVEKSASGKTLQFKLGWNEVLTEIQKEMKNAGFDYTFPSLDRSVATDNYTPADLTMDEETQEHFFEALKKVANKEICRYNKEANKNRKLITKIDAKSLNEVFKGKLPLNLMMFRTMFNEPSSRFFIGDDLLYSSMATQNLAANHNGLYSVFNAQGGVGGYKTKQGTIIYWADILKKTWKPSTLRNEGGVRNQSNSDFLMYTLLDHAQMYIDFTAKGYYLQAYTKVLAELKLFGLSKGKINASFIPKVEVYYNKDGSIDVAKTQENAGLDKQGNPIYDDIEGINHKEAFMLIEDAEYSKSIGGVCIGYSDKHISKLLDDNRIQLIIGFHDKTNDTSKRYRGAVYSKNYNGFNEATKLDKDGKLKTVHIGFNQFVRRAEGKFKTKDTIEYNGKTYNKNDIPKLATDLYLEHCEEKGLFPAYSQGGTDFSKHPNYYKLLADFSLYDINGNYAPHQKVEYNMPDQVPYLDENGNKAYMKTEDYVKKELQSELTVRDSISEKLADKSENGIIPQFIERANALYEEQQEHKQFADREIAEIDTEYLELAKNPESNDAKLRELVKRAAMSKGFTIKVLHGTTGFGFTKIYLSKSDDGISFFATDSVETAGTYSGSQNIKRIADSSMQTDENREKILKSIQSESIDFAEFCNSKLGIRGWVDYDYFLNKINECVESLENGTKLSEVQEDFVGFCDEMFYTFIDNYYYENYNEKEFTLEAFEESKEYADLSDKFYDYVYKIEGQFNSFDYESTTGIYDLYANTEGLLEFDAQGKSWNRLPDPRETNGKLGISEEFGFEMFNTRDYAAYAKENGYKGVKITNLFDDGGKSVQGQTKPATVYIFFNPQEQVKSADAITYDNDGKVIPLSERFNTQNDDLRFSDRDSEGKTLTEEQIEFFKDSKIRDKNGNLLVVRHGTSDDFHIFDFSKSGKNGKAEGYGFYFSDDTEITKSYGNIQKEVYLNITKPLYNNKRTIKKAEMVKLVDALIDFDLKKWGGTWQDSFISNYVNTYEFQMSRRYGVQQFVNQIWEYNDNDQDLIFEVAQADGRMYENSTMREFYDVLTESIGYDGIIAEWSHADGKSNVYVTFNPEQSKYTSNKTPTTNQDMRYSDRIKENMSEEERYDILKNRQLTLSQPNAIEYSKIINSNPALLDKRLKTKEAEKILKKIGEEFGVFTEYRNNDVELEFEFGKNNLSESVNKQKGNYYKYVQMLSCFSDVISNAIGIECHNRNNEGYKPDKTLKMIYVLSSAFETNNEIVPVKLEIKEFFDKPNRLYVAVALEDIKKDRVAGMGVPTNRSHVRTSPVTISIHDLFSKINPIDIDFLKYIPNGFLNDEQIEAKRKALGDIRYSDRDYIAYDMTSLLKESTIDKYLVEYASKTTPNYAQAYITYMSPRSFLALTTSGMDTENAIARQTKEFNREEFEEYTSNQVPIQLGIDHESGEVIGHEGRHRMVALSREGILEVPVLLFDYNNKTNKKNIDEIRLKGQFNEFRTAIVNDAIPLSYANREAIIEKFGTMSNRQKMNERYGIRQVLNYSDRDNVSVYDLMGENDTLIKENEQLKEDIERLKERLKIERQVTNGNYFNENQLNAVAGHIRNIARSNYNKKDLVTLLNGIYQYIAHSPDLNWQDLFAQCYDVAGMVLNEARDVTVTDEYFKGILDDIRGAKISVNEKQIAEAKQRLGNRWRNSFLNKVKIVENGTSLYRQWQSWSSAYPNIFDAEIVDADMLVELYDIYDDVRKGSEVVVEYDMEEQTRHLAREIYNQYWNVSPIRTTADKYDKQIKRLNFEHRKAMKDFRDKYDERLKSQHIADKEKAQELIKKVRERKDKEIADVKQRSKERMDAYKENAERKTRIQSITSNALTLNKMLTTNSKDQHINETLKPVVINLLKAIDFSSKQMLNKNIPTQKDISLYKALEEVKSMLSNANNETALSDLTELYGIDMDEEITALLKSSFEILTDMGDNGFILNQMSLTDLQTLDKVVKTIKRVVNKLNKFHVANHNKGVADLGHNSVEDFDKLGQEKVYDQQSLKGKLKKLLNWGNVTPYYAFKKFGKGGQVMFEALQDGWDKLSYNIKAIMDFTKATYTNKEVREWSQEIKDVKVHDIITGKDVTVHITVAQAMSLYCSLKREQAKGHILGDGIRITDIPVKKGKMISQTEGVKVGLSDLDALTNVLTKRQIEVADKLQEFMNTTCTDWGNEISMARFGYKAFGEENYFPISSDKNNLAVDDAKEENNSLFRLLNMSFTKSVVKGANNKIEIRDIFDVFAQHTSDMAKYNSLALPVLDFYKWYNYTEKGIVDGEKRTIASLKASMEKAFGKDAKDYVTTFLKDINGQYDVSRDSIGKSFFKNAKIASVGMNLRVVLLQPTSYLRASAVIDNKYLTKALLHKPKMSKATEHCGIALWKSLGYYDTNIQRGITDQIKHNEGWKDKAIEWSMKGAEMADKLTWGYLWNACELEIRETRKDLTVGSKEFYETIGKRLREVIYATQVVDSTMTRSQMMRSPSMYDKMLTSFASEPTLSYSMLYDAIESASLEKRANGKVSKDSKKKIARVLVAYTMTNAVAALVEAGFDAYREEDDEEMDLAEFMKMYLSNFAFDMSITAKIPYIKEFTSVLQGFSTSRTDTQWMQSIGYALKGWSKVAFGNGNPTSAMKNSLRSLAYLTGLPFYNAYRDFMAGLNKLDILTAEELEELLDDLFN